jgi:PAS domain S-box-containing protein
MSPRSNAPSLLVETVRAACLDAALLAYEDAGVRGLCAEGRWEAALSAIRHLARSSIAALPQDVSVRILDGSPDAILICDRAGIVGYWNAAAERVFGFSVTEAVGASMNLIIPERLRVRHWAGWEGTMTTGVTRYGEGQLLAVSALHKDGRQISMEFSIQLLKDPAGQIEWVVAIVRDVTERFLREKSGARS